MVDSLFASLENLAATALEDDEEGDEEAEGEEEDEEEEEGEGAV